LDDCRGGILPPENDRRFLDAYLAREAERAAARHAAESPQTALARAVVESYVRTGRIPAAAAGGDEGTLPEEMTARRAGVFVSIKKHGALRGCIGTIAPTAGSVADEIRQNAVSAATRDPRFEAITEDELPYLSISVDVLGDAEPVASEDALDPKRYGVIVSLGGRRGLLLPDLDGVDTAAEQVSIAMKKAGIAERDRARVKLERFEVVRYT
jgi:AmmeMemoRadiSam system protein A